MQTPTIPHGGFLAFQGAAHQDLNSRLAADGRADSVVYADQGVVLAAWSQFPGQGLWQGQGGAVAYDIDLTNQEALCPLVDLPVTTDPGALLFALYRRFGQAFPDQLRGAFAFALWDAAAADLLVVNDGYGIRPVVHTRSDNRFAAASRLRQLELAGFERRINPEAIYHYLFFQAICSPISIYRDVDKLEPGALLLSSNGRVEQQQWYDLRYQPIAGRSEEDWCRDIQQQVKAAVGRFVPAADGPPTGCFLSGGTDSSSIVGSYAEHSRQPVATFSIGFDDPRFNELDFARLAVERFGTDQHEYLVTPQDVLKLIHSLPQIYDEPLGNASVVAAYYCAQLAREQGIHTLLGGDGGDEIFGGNERYVSNLVFKKYADLPAWFRRRLFEPLLRLTPARGPFYKARRYVRRANLPNPRRFYSYNLLAESDNATIFQPDFLQQIDSDCFFQRAQQVYDQAAPAAETDRLLYLDMKFTITDNDLRKVTQMVEAAGLRVGYPLLDRDLVDFTGTIPPALKVKPGRNRYIFKQAMRGFLPDGIIHKSKHGMGLPIASWLRDDQQLNTLLEDNLFSPSARVLDYVRADYLEQLKQHFYSDTTTTFYGDNLWVFLILELWLREHL